MSTQDSTGSPPKVQTTDSGIVNNRIDTHWWSWGVRGGFAILFALLVLIALFVPFMNFNVMWRVFSAFMLLDGAIVVIEALKRQYTDPRWLALFLEGLAGIIVGASTMFMPVIAFAGFVRVTGFWAEFTGMLKVVQSMKLGEEPADDRRRFSAGIISILAGFALLLWPFSDPFTVILFLGGYTLVFGVLMLFVSAQQRTLPEVPAVEVTNR